MKTRTVLSKLREMGGGHRIEQGTTPHDFEFFFEVLPQLVFNLFSQDFDCHFSFAFKFSYIDSSRSAFTQQREELNVTRTNELPRRQNLKRCLGGGDDIHLFLK